MSSEKLLVKENAAAVSTVSWSRPSERARQASAHHHTVSESGLAGVEEQVRKSLASIHRQMIVLPTQAEQWRAAATELSVNAALSTIPDVRSSMVRIAEGYQGMARLAEQSYASYLKEERIVCFGGRVFLCV
jgi:hypothetical protein